METVNTNKLSLDSTTADAQVALGGPRTGAHPHAHDHDHDNAQSHADHERARTQSRPKRDMSHIQGWGADLDHKNRPAVPMERTPPRLEGAPLPFPAQQPQHMEVLVSTERPGITPLFGTGPQPKGLSGLLRRQAFKTTENDIRHWLLLILADRVDMVEGIGEDLAKGKVPNVLSEMGIKAEWQHNKAGLVQKVAVAGLVAGAAYYLLRGRSDR